MTSSTATATPSSAPFVAGSRFSGGVVPSTWLAFISDHRRVLAVLAFLKA